MPSNNKLLKTDQKTMPVPQYFNDTTDDYEVVKGSNGAAFMQLTGSNVKDDTLQNAAAATGLGTPLDVTGKSMICFQVKGTFVGTITFEASNDSGTTWDSLKVFRINGDPGTTTATAPGIFQTSVAALKSVRANITAYTSGNITVLGTASVVG